MATTPRGYSLRENKLFKNVYVLTIKLLNVFLFLGIMLLRYLKLENIRSYTNDVIQFSPGSSLLLGDIGAGKTSVLLGIEFALFGLIKGDVSGATLLRHGKNFGSVELCFEIDGREIIVVRKLKRKNDAITQDSGYIIIDNRKIEGTPVELKSKILELFGYPEDLLNKSTSLIYRYTVYTPQEDMKAILFESKEDRLDTLRRIFNIDRYKRIRENALEYSKELRNMKRILESKIADIEDKRQELLERKEKSSMIKSELEDAKKQHAEIKDILDQRNEELKGFEQKVSELNVLKKELAVNEATLKNKKAEAEKARKDFGVAEYRIKDYEQKLKDMGIIDQDEGQLRANLKDSEDKLQRLSIAKETIKERLKSKEDDLNNIIIEDQASLNAREAMLRKRFEALPEKQRLFDENKQLYDKVSLDIHSLRISKQNSEDVVLQLKDLSICPTCQQNVEMSHKVKIMDKESANASTLARRIIELENKHSELQRSILNGRKELDQLRLDEFELREVEIKLKNIDNILNNRKQLEMDIEELKKKSAQLDRMDVNKLMDIVSRNRKMLSNIEVKKHIEDALKEKFALRNELNISMKSLEDELKAIAEQYNIVNAKIAGLADIEKVYNEKRNEIDIINKSLMDSEISISSINKDFEYLHNEIRKLEEEIRLKTRIKEKISYLGELNHWMTEHFIYLTAIIEKAIMQKVHGEFDELFRKWFDIMMETDELDVRIDEEFTPVIVQNNYETGIENLSGGERTSVALAYRLALNKVINDFINTIKTKDIIILDEPTDGFSSEQLDKMREVFDELRIGQLIIVSHEAKMESYVQNIIRIGKSEHNSKVLI